MTTIHISTRPEVFLNFDKNPVTFLEKKCTELANTGHQMDDEMFITHLLNSLPQSEHEGAKLVIKDKLRKEDVELSEIEQILKDIYQAMKHAKG